MLPGLNLRRLASFVYPRPIKLAEVLNQNARMHGWIREQGAVPGFADRLGLYAHIRHLVGAAPIDYLEFGVYRGASIRWFTEHHPHPDSRFFGFDSFEGLPEAWELGRGGLGKGALTTDGRMPQIDDSRVQFVKGWYQATLPGFLEGFAPRSRLVVHCDSDLYSSTLYVLTMLDRLLVPGSIVLFDEFCNHEEFRAYMDYSAAYQRRSRAIGTAQVTYKNVAVEMLPG